MTTNEELIIFLNHASAYLAEKKDERSQVIHALNKLTKKYAKQIERWQQDLNDYIEDLRTDACSKDDKGLLIEEKVILKNKDGNESAIFRKRYTPEAEKKLRKDINAYQRQKLDEDSGFTPHICDLPKDFDAQWVPRFTGFIFQEQEEVK